MSHTPNWIFMAFFVIAVIGFGLYMYEVLQGNIGRFTRWSELDKRGIIAAALVLGGGFGLMATVVITVISRNI